MIKKILIGLVVLLLIGFAYYQFWFLRQPERTIPTEKAVFVSPANGKIVAVTPWNRDSLIWDKDLGVVKVLTSDIADEGWLIAIEMDVTHVHYQRAPANGRLIAEEYTDGKFKNALIQDKNNPFAFRLENERNTLFFETTKGIKYKVVQIAGLLARRIEDYVTPEQIVKRGEVIGLIKLGSQVALILPNTVKPTVKNGDLVIDGETIVARVLD